MVRVYRHIHSVFRVQIANLHNHWYTKLSEKISLPLNFAHIFFWEVWIKDEGGGGEGGGG